MLLALYIDSVNSDVAIVTLNIRADQNHQYLLFAKLSLYLYFTPVFLTFTQV